MAIRPPSNTAGMDSLVRPERQSRRGDLHDAFLRLRAVSGRAAAHGLHHEARLARCRSAEALCGQLLDRHGHRRHGGAGNTRRSRRSRRRCGRRTRWRERPGDARCSRSVADHGRHDGHRVRRPYDVVRGRRRGGTRGRSRQGGAADCPEQAGHRSDRVASPLRSHRRPAPGGCRRIDGHLQARQRCHLQGDDVTADAELPRRARPQSQAAQVRSSGRSPSAQGRDDDGGHLPCHRQQPHGRRGVRLHPRAQGDDRGRHRHRGRRSSVVGRQLAGQHQLPEDRRAGERPRAHGRDDAGAGAQDGGAGHSACEGLLRAAPREGQLLSGLSRAGQVAQLTLARRVAHAVDRAGASGGHGRGRHCRESAGDGPERRYRADTR